MKILETKHQTIFESEDLNGTFQLKIHNDLSQLQLETNIEDFGDEAFIDITRDKLFMIRDMINGMLNDTPEAQQQIERWQKKAEKWDELDDKIGKCYPTEEDEDEDYDDEYDLTTIGELAATAFGYM